MTSALRRFIAFENICHRLLVSHSVAALRVSVGAVFLGFGVLKYFPGVSPAEGLATATTDVLFLGLVPAGGAIYIVATMECFIGLCFLIGSGALMRVAIWVLAAQFVGILSPLVIEPGRLFAGPHGAPTLEGQYVLKDIILVAAGMVIAAGSFRGGRMMRPSQPEQAGGDRSASDAELELARMLATVHQGSSLDEVCAEHGVSEESFHRWRTASLAAAETALRRDERVSSPT